MPENEQMQSFLTELRRGSLILAVLGSLKEPRYGYALLQFLKERGIEIEANTLYPLLRRLEGQGLLQSDWDTAESRPRKYYVRNDAGDKIFGELTAEWKKLQTSIESVCREDEADEKLD